MNYENYFSFNSYLKQARNNYTYGYTKEIGQNLVTIYLRAMTDLR